MIAAALEQELHQQLSVLSLEQQRQVLDFARALALARPHGVPGETLLRFGGMFDPDDLRAMEQAIEEECEKIDPDGW